MSIVGHPADVAELLGVEKAPMHLVSEGLGVRQMCKNKGQMQKECGVFSDNISAAMEVLM